jgi:surface polysaccharide O-acyltransferase-like enzyme
MFFRMLGVLFLVLDLVKGVVTGEWAGTEFWFLVLIAEYASTIRNVPPAEVAKAATKAPARS